MSEKLYTNIGRLLTLQGAAKKQARNIQEPDLSILCDASLKIKNKKITWVGLTKDLTSDLKQGADIINLEQATVLPGFVECHTHSLFAGDRSVEFEQKLQGKSYQEIAASGGGIKSTVKATREASDEELLSLLKKRIGVFKKQGVAAIEIKTGYGLSVEQELRQLKLIHQLQELSRESQKIVSTFLGAHAIPDGYKSGDVYLNELAANIKQIQEFTNRADIFIEQGFFSKEQAQAYLSIFQKNGFDLTIHADQLSLCGGSELGVALNAKSVDHAVCIEEQTIQKLAGSEVTVVGLPAADLYMKIPYPPMRKLIDCGARVALATDFNPGTSPTLDLALVGFLARREMKMHLSEVLCAYTLGAAFALGVEKEFGSLDVGKRGAFSVLERGATEHDLFYSVGLMPIAATVF